jgi:putative transposase
MRCGLRSAPREGTYGRRKMTSHLRRHGHRVAACTVDRLMREGMSGVIRARKHRTTIPGGKDSRRAPDLLDRDFSAAAPNRKWVTDFTYCRTWSGFVYVAFVVDCFSRAIVGWHVATSKDTAMVTTALKMALWQRDRCRVDSSQRCRCTIYLDCVRGNACAGGDCSIYG